MHFTSIAISWPMAILSISSFRALTKHVLIKETFNCISHQSGYEMEKTVSDKSGTL